MQERILTPEQVAEIIQVHQFTVLKFIKQGRLIASKIGRVYRIRESDLDHFLDQAAGQPGRTAKKKNEGSELPNQDNKSKNKNKPSLTPTEPVASTEIEPIAPETKIESENDTTQQYGGKDHYFILK